MVRCNFAAAAPPARLSAEPDAVPARPSCAEEPLCPTTPRTPTSDGSRGAFYQNDPFPHFKWKRERPAVFCSEKSSRSDAPAIPSMINLDGKEHERRCNLVNKGFTGRRVEGQEDKIRAICTELIDRIAPLGRCDFVRDVAAPAWARSKRARR